MGIYLIKNEFGCFKNIVPVSSDEQRPLIDGYGKSLKSTWMPISFKWDLEDGTNVRDAFLHLGSILVVNKKVISELQNFLDGNETELLPIDVEGDSFYVVNPYRKELDLLDVAHSEIEFFKDHSIKWIREYVFKSYSNCPQLFHIAEIATPIFASESFTEAYNKAGLTGLKFEECKQVRPGILKSILKKITIWQNKTKNAQNAESRFRKVRVNKPRTAHYALNVPRR